MSADLPSPAEVAALFASAQGARGILLAVSGGPDSMAMLRLAAQWRDSTGCPPMCVATVDHGLRPEARAEAAQVGQWSAAQGFVHHTLPWEGAKPKTRLQEAARNARYALLAAHARARGADHILLAHHLDDQAETVLFRLARGSGIDGLAGMESVSRHAGVTLLRPLLAWPKARLVALCAAVGQPYVEDPSNADPRFARTRLRQLGAVLAAQGLDAPALARLAMRAARARDALAAQQRDMMTQIAPKPFESGLVANIGPLLHAPEEIALRCAGALVGQVCGPQVQPRLERLERLCAGILPALARNQPFRATLAGTILVLDANQRLTITRETPRLRGRKLPALGVAAAGQAGGGDVSSLS